MMKNYRTHGNVPYRVAVLHGGPGAPGEVEPVARELSTTWGVLEPFQTRNTIDGQVEELREVLEQNGVQQVALIGWSWGAWLGLIFAARYPSMVEKLLLVSSGAFDVIYVQEAGNRRLSRLNEEEQFEWKRIVAALNNPDMEDRDIIFSRFDALITKTDRYDTFDPTDAESAPGDPIEEIAADVMRAQSNIYQTIWPEAAEMRSSGTLLELARSVTCPVVAIHGDYDPTPSEGVRAPLVPVISRFKFTLLANCGHSPWLERQAREEFYSVLRSELRTALDESAV